MRKIAGIVVVLLLSLSGVGCVVRAVPGPPPGEPPPPPPGPAVGVTVTHEPGHPPPPPPPPAPPPPPRELSCDDAERIAHDYAAQHQMGAMTTQNCHREEHGSVIEVFLKGEHHGPKRHLKLRIDAHDGRVLDAKEEEHHGEGHGHGHGHDGDDD